MYRFLYDAADACMIDGLGLPINAEADARNRERAKEVIARMGPKWCCYRAPDRLTNEDESRAANDAMDAQNEMDTHSANNYTEEE